jgi:hypothetical protein
MAKESKKRSRARVRGEAREPVHLIHFEEKIFDQWPLKNGETVRVSIDYDSGYDLIHVRRCRRGPNGELYPTQKGVAIQIGHLRRLLKALREVRAHAREIGLLPPRSRSR